ncbi:hypothetical protein LEP1GSC202_2775 [Leptospira yanagawae serovar Saopaulo str. Sao Paulo = ATCC 700523]|uniref:Uncharacterized protein n=1 Tax=Leptospira yanagawae serovar Saopaulo str. Sao Paulo = ATCC 700523 TaxID=1249483 RepID=A0A5E8HD55_9LEPT|nr:hypothetical protein [Leptospira yanagawae]EOQ88733.1 hypothetical protein LEP1GSC202_2775 [Leptospira yanagawae serovar Saopaulo str. Sao Paulo = ATCC 700523]
MQRSEFLSRISLTALLVSGIRQNLEAKKTKEKSNLNDLQFEIPYYPIERTSEIISSILSKLSTGEIELNLFLDSFAKELELRFPLKQKNKISSYNELYSYSVKIEIVCELTSVLIGIWQNLCIQIGLYGYQIEDFKTDSKSIKTSMIGFGKKMNNFKIPIISDLRSKGKWWDQSEMILRLPWFGGIKSEKIISNKMNLEQIFDLDLKQIKNSNQSEFSFISIEFFQHTKNLQYQIDRIRARWHQYAVRFYYMAFVQKKYKLVTSNPIVYQNLIRSYGFESAIKTIQNRAFHMQSGIYHYLDRQSQQMVVSSLVLMLKDLGKSTGGDKNLFRILKLENSYGGIISVSTGMSAMETFKNLEEGILYLKEERKKLFTQDTL